MRYLLLTIDSKINLKINSMSAMKIVIVPQTSNFSEGCAAAALKRCPQRCPLNIVVKKFNLHFNLSLHFLDNFFFGNLQSPPKKRFELPEKYFPPSKEMILTHQRKSSLLRLLRSVPPPPSSFRPFSFSFPQINLETQCATSATLYFQF